MSREEQYPRCGALCGSVVNVNASDPLDQTIYKMTHPYPPSKEKTRMGWRKENPKEEHEGRERRIYRESRKSKDRGKEKERKHKSSRVEVGQPKEETINTKK